MAIRKINPTSPGQRGMTKSDFAEITTNKPEKSLLKDLRKTAGRNNTGRITCRHKGGGHKRAYRVIDFKREKFGIPAVVKTIEYDPNRNVRISLVVYADGEKRYILTPHGLNVGDTIVSGKDADILTGNALPLEMIPLGTMVHCVELEPGKGGKMVRKECLATVGVLGNAEFKNMKIGKAGRTRYMGIRPTVRGVTMNPCDHPHGGGEGKTGPGGNPKTPWGKPALGIKTRNKKKASGKLIVRERKRG